MKKQHWKRLIIAAYVVLVLAVLFAIDTIMFCTWFPYQASVYWTQEGFGSPQIERRLKVASYLFVPVDLLCRYSDGFYRFTQNWSEQTFELPEPEFRQPSPFLWRIATFYWNGNIESHQPYWGATQHGWRYEWYKGGQKKFAAHDIHDIRVGECTYWNEDGQKSFECLFSNGKQEGYEIRWDSNGFVRVYGLFKKGARFDGSFETSFYKLNDNAAFDAIIHYRAGKFVAAFNDDGTPVSNAYYHYNYVLGKCMHVHFLIADGIVTNAIDGRTGNLVPRDQWLEDFR